MSRSLPLNKHLFWLLLFVGLVANCFRGIELSALRIFDRWGAVVFETQDATEGWTGNNRNAKVNPSTYAWVLQYTFIHPEQGPIEQLDSGEFLLIR